MTRATSKTIIAGEARGPVLASTEPLSFWGGVDPRTGEIIDVHHPLRGACLSGAVLALPTSRGSCSGSGVLLDLILNGRAPAALVFGEGEDVLTLGASIAAEMFDAVLPIVQLEPAAFASLLGARHASVTPDALVSDAVTIPLQSSPASRLALSGEDREALDGAAGPAKRCAMRVIAAAAVRQGAERLIDVAQAHIDGCIYASPANLVFAEAMARMGARVAVPTTMNAISVDYRNWREQAVDPAFGSAAQRLADVYVEMGCRPTFTCAPYLLPSAPRRGEAVGWAESNAVIYANSVLGARTAKHPDFLDLCIAVAGRAPAAGPYLDEHRRPDLVLDVDAPDAVDDSFWPLLGYLCGRAAQARVPLIRGVAGLRPSDDDLKALCAAFGTTSASPMLHVEGVTAEADTPPLAGSKTLHIARAEMAEVWGDLNRGPDAVDLIAIGSPHASLGECRALADAIDVARGERPGPGPVPIMVTASRQVVDAARADGTLARLSRSGVRVLSDLCWCSITEPVLPRDARTIATNSGKYAHYGPGLSGRRVRLGSLEACARASFDGRLSDRPPFWLETAPVTPSTPTGSTRPEARLSPPAE